MMLVLVLCAVKCSDAPLTPSWLDADAVVGNADRNAAQCFDGAVMAGGEVRVITRRPRHPCRP